MTTGFKELQPVKATMKEDKPIKTILREQQSRDFKTLKNFLK